MNEVQKRLRDTAHAINPENDRWQTWVSHVERVIIGTAIKLILAKVGFAITVWDGEDNAISTSMDANDIIEHVGSTEVTVFTIFNADCKVEGWLAFIHGNNEDTLSDASTGDYITSLIEAIETEVGAS